MVPVPAWAAMLVVVLALAAWAVLAAWAALADPVWEAPELALMVVAAFIAAASAPAELALMAVAAFIAAADMPMAVAASMVAADMPMVMDAAMAIDIRIEGMVMAIGHGPQAQASHWPQRGRTTAAMTTVTMIASSGGPIGAG